MHKIQAGYKITPLSRWGKTPERVTVKIDPTVDMKTPPMKQTDTMPSGAYFTYAAELLKLQPPHLTDEPIIAQMKRIGIEPGKSFDISRLDPAVRKGMEAAPAEAQELMRWKVPTIARVVNHWSMNTDTMGVYGNYYLKRAIVAQLGLGANLPEDAIYPLNLARRNRQAAGRRESVCYSLRERRHPTGSRVLVHHALRRGRLPGSKCAESVCREQLDAFPVQCGRFARPLLSKRQSGRGQGSELASSAESAVQSDYAALLAAVRCVDGEVESASREKTVGGPIATSRAWRKCLCAMSPLPL